jgi:hypothetical protein
MGTRTPFRLSRAKNGPKRSAVKLAQHSIKTVPCPNEASLTGVNNHETNIQLQPLALMETDKGLQG